MMYGKKDLRRKLLHPEAVLPNLSWGWDSNNYIKAKNTRIIALSGLENLNIYGLDIIKPMGIIEIIGSRMATLSTVMLAIFSSEEQEKKSTFRLDSDLAIGSICFPPAMFSGLIQLTSAPALYFRMGKDGVVNSISNDCYFNVN